MYKKIKSFFFENTSVRQTVAKNTFWLGVSNLGGRLIRAFIIIYAARVLGAEQWGVFSYAITLAAFLTIFIDFGINHILTRETAKATDAHARTRILSTTLFLKLLFIAIGAMLILTVAPAIARIPEARALFPLIVFVVAFDTLREFVFALSRALETMQREVGLFFLTNIAIVALGFLFLARAPTVYSFTLAYTLGTGIGAAATLFAFRRYLRPVASAGVSWPLIKPTLAAAWPFAISGILGMLMTNTDILVIGALRPASDVGYYSAALRIIQLRYILPSVISGSVLPLFSRLAATDNARMRAALERVLSFSFLAAVPLSAGGIIVARDLIPFIFGPEFLPAVVPFQILMLTMMIDFPSVILSNAVFAYNRQRNLIAFSAIGGGLNVALDIALIPRFGIIGSAWATLVAQLTSNIYLWRTLHAANPFRVLPRLGIVFRAAFLSSLAALLGTMLDLHVAAVIPLAGGVYAMSLYLFREPLLREIRSIFRSEIPA